MAEVSRTQEAHIKNAEKFLLNFIKVGSSSRFFAEAHFDLGDVYIRSKKFDEARKILSSIEKASNSPYVKGRAQSETAKSYLEEGDVKKAMEVGMTLLRAGQVNEGIIEIFSIVLIDKGREYEKAYKLTASLLGKGDRAAQKKVRELRGCAAFHLKKYSEGLEDLLMAQLLYGDEETASSRLKVYLASTIHVLMKNKPSEYGQWEYNPPYVGLRRGFNVSDGKRFSKLVQKL